VNRVELIARIVEVSSMRYTPSGQPVVDIKLSHESQIEEAGIQRKVSLLMKSKAVGLLAEKLILLPLDSTFLFIGFLASGSNSKNLVFHIHSYQSVS
jgi:primosomal replication protein N